MLLCHTGLALSSSVAGFGVSLPSVSFLLRSSFVIFIFGLRFVSLSSFILSLGPLTAPYVSCSGYGLVPVLSVSCSISFRACLIQISFFRFVVVHSSQVHLVWLCDHHLRRVLVASHRPPFELIRSYIWIQAALLRIAAPAKLPHVILRIVDQPPRPALTRCRRLITLRFRCLSPRYSWSLVRHNHKS